MILSPTLKPAILIHSNLLIFSCLCLPLRKMIPLKMVFGPHHQSRTKWKRGKPKDQKLRDHLESILSTVPSYSTGVQSPE